MLIERITLIYSGFELMGVSDPQLDVIISEPTSDPE